MNGPLGDKQEQLFHHQSYTKASNYKPEQKNSLFLTRAEGLSKKKRITYLFYQHPTFLFSFLCQGHFSFGRNGLKSNHRIGYRKELTVVFILSFTKESQVMRQCLLSSVRLWCFFNCESKLVSFLAKTNQYKGNYCMYFVNSPNAGLTKINHDFRRITEAIEK